MHQNTPTEGAFMPSSVLVRCVASTRGCSNAPRPEITPWKTNEINEMVPRSGRVFEVGARRRSRQQIIEPFPTRARRPHESTDNCTKVTSTMENLFVESPAHPAQWFGALHRATERAEQRRQDTLTALPDVSSPPIAPEAIAPLSEAPSAFSNAIALVAAAGLAGVAAFFKLGASGALIALNLFGASVNRGIGANFLAILCDGPAGKCARPENTGGPRCGGER
jgi:hypothetical protein